MTRPSASERSVELPVLPPVAPMLARLARDVPRGDGLLYEPKWDGFRCLVFRAGDALDMRSRHQSPLSRYFPELAESFSALDEQRFVVDGEIVVTGPRGFDFVALLQRLHPAPSRVERLSHETPASFIAFDLLALGGDDLRPEPFEKRRSLLERLLRGVGAPLFLTPVTRDPDIAHAWLERFNGGGVDGLVAKDARLPYRAGKRAMVKVKQERTADCVVAGFRWHHDEPTVGSLLLGLYDAGALRHVGLATSFTASRRQELLADVSPFVAHIDGHPWERGFGVQTSALGRLPGAASRWADGRELTWVPLRPDLVCEVAYDHLEGDRFRHPARFRRWRPDRDARSCTYDQFEAVGSDALSEIVATGR